MAPKKKARPQGNGPAQHTHILPNPSDLREGFQRRAEASRRLPPLERRTARLDDIRPAQLAAWRRTRAHLHAAGLPAVVPPEVERALRARGWWE